MAEKVKTAAKAQAIGFKNLAKWKKVPTDEAGYDLDELTFGSLHFDELFGRTPEFLMVHTGSVKRTGAVTLDGWKAAKDAQHTLYVIDGDLELDGSLVFNQCDVGTGLLVTGELKLRRLACYWGAQLAVGKSLAVSELLLTYLDDSGHLCVHGQLSAPAWLDIGFRGSIEFGQLPKTRFLSDYFAAQELEVDDEADSYTRRRIPAQPAIPAVVPELVSADYDHPDTKKALAALIAGKPLLR